MLALVAEGLSYKEVGDRVYLSPRTVKYHMAEIMRKLHLKNRAQVLAAAKAVIEGGAGRPQLGAARLARRRARSLQLPDPTVPRDSLSPTGLSLLLSPRPL